MILSKNLFRYCSDFGRIKPAGISLSDNIVIENVSSPQSGFPASSLVLLLLTKLGLFIIFCKDMSPENLDS